LSKSSLNHKLETRPDFMVVLDLLPPYTQEDVKRAYLAKAKQVHPDHGGTVERFRQLQEAFDKGRQYTEFRSDRRNWIAARMNDYIEVQKVEQQFQQYGADVTSHSNDWLEKSLGDFAQLTESIIRVRLADSPNADEMIRFMVTEPVALATLQQLELPGCQLSDDSVLQLGIFQQLQTLDLSRTSISHRALSIAEVLPELETLKVEGITLGWWAKYKLNRLLRRHLEARPATPFGA
jgi:hypothetical protein